MRLSFHSSLMLPNWGELACGHDLTSSQSVGIGIRLPLACAWHEVLENLSSPGLSETGLSTTITKEQHLSSGWDVIWCISEVYIKSLTQSKISCTAWSWLGLCVEIWCSWSWWLRKCRKRKTSVFSFELYILFSSSHTITCRTTSSVLIVS